MVVVKVKIPFLPRFKEPMLNGIKTWTSRTRRYGNVGDTFEAFGETFQLTDMYKAVLHNLIWFFYREEGFNSPEEFIECWKQIHPRKGFDGNQKVWVHVFKKEKATTP